MLSRVHAIGVRLVLSPSFLCFFFDIFVDIVLFLLLSFFMFVFHFFIFIHVFIIIIILFLFLLLLPLFFLLLVRFTVILVLQYLSIPFLQTLTNAQHRRLSVAYISTASIHWTPTGANTITAVRVRNQCIMFSYL